MNNNQKQVAPLQTITANALMQTDYPPLAFSIEKLLPQGIFILAGSGKIGKSWLALDMCVAVSTNRSIGTRRRVGQKSIKISVLTPTR